RGVLAASDVALTLRRGEVLGVVGESGSGKSTVARCIARLIDPTEGTIESHDKDVARLSRRKMRSMRRNIQIVFQDPYRSLNPRLRVGEAIIEGLRNFDVDRVSALHKARELLRVVGLDET